MIVPFGYLSDMSKFSKLIKALAAIIKRPYLLNLILDDSEYHKKFIPANYQNGLPKIDLNDWLANENKLALYSFSDGGSLITDLLVLKAAVKQFNHPNYFEIGTWRGESIVNVADFCSNAFTLNLADEDLKTLGVEDEMIKQQAIFSKNHPKITHLKGDSMTFDFSPYYGKMDVVFVDGDHHFDSVKKDTETAFKLIKDENSIIVWHDYSLNTKTIRFEVLRGILEGTPNHLKAHLYHIHQTLCAVYCNRKFKQKPNTSLNTFSVSLNKI